MDWMKDETATVIKISNGMFESHKTDGIDMFEDGLSEDRF